MQPIPTSPGHRLPRDPVWPFNSPTNNYAATVPSKTATELSRDLASDTEKAMTPHSSTLAWKIPWTEEPGRLQSMGLLGVGHD